MEIKPIKLSVKRSGNGYIGSYTVNLGSSEVKKCGFIGDDGNPVPIEKVIDEENKTILIRLQKTEQDDKG